MANVWFKGYRNNRLGDATYAAVVLSSDTIITMLVDHGIDTPAPTTDQDLSNISSSARVPAAASCPTLASKTVGVVGVGVFDAADATFSALTSASVESLIVVKYTGTDATSILLGFWDTFGSGMPVTPSGGDVIVQWPAGGLWTVG